MQYNRTRWVNNTTKLNQNNMNNIEDGIEGLVSEINKTNQRMPSLVNDLNVGGLNSALTAEAGKRLNENIIILNEKMDKVVRVDKSQKLIQKMTNKQEVNIVCYGSNLTYGLNASTSGKVTTPYPDYLQSLLRGYYNYNNIIVHNVGILNAQLDELLLPENLKKVKDINPDLVILEPGILDKIGKDSNNPITDFSIFSQRLDQLRDKLKDYDLLVVNMPENISTGYENSEIINNEKMRYQDVSYNETIRLFSLKYSLPFIDIRTKLNGYIDNVIKYRPDIFTDTVNLTQDGYNKYSELIFSNFFAPHIIIDREMRADVLDPLWRSTSSLPIASGEVSNKDFYNLNCTENNTIMINFFVETPYMYVDLIKILANVEGEVIISSSSIDRPSMKSTGTFTSFISGSPDKRSNVSDYIGKFRYGYNFIKLTFTGTVKIQGIKFYNTNIEPIINKNQIVTNNNVVAYDVQKITDNNLSMYKTIHIDTVMDGYSNIAIGSTRMATSSGGIIIVPMYSICISSLNSLVGFYKYQLNASGVIQTTKLGDIPEISFSSTGNECSIDFIEYDNRTEVYFNKNLLYTFTVPGNVLGDKNIYCMNYTTTEVNSIKTTITNISCFKEIIDVNRIPAAISGSTITNLMTNMNTLSTDINQKIQEIITTGQVNTEDIKQIEEALASGKILNDNFFNIAVIHELKNDLEYVELWLLINAKYNHETKRFQRINVDNFSFGWQMQAGGTYPGEEGYDDINQGVNLWKANGKKAYAQGDPMRDQTNEDIGMMVDGKWKEYGIMGGWTNVFMLDSYGGMTIGGAGFEIDGNGMYPYRRVSLGKFSGGSTQADRDQREYVFGYCGECWNIYHGLWGMDDMNEDSLYWGMEAPIKWMEDGQYNPYSNRCDLAQAKFVIKHLPKWYGAQIENWHNIMEIDIATGQGKLKGQNIQTNVVLDLQIVNVTDFNVLYPDATWNKDNTLIVAIKGTLSDGTVKQFPAPSATFTDEGIFGKLSDTETFTSAKIILSKI